MTKEEILKRVKKFQGANREFSQELPPIIEGLIDLIDEAGPEVVDNLESNSPTKALSAKQGKELNVKKQDAPATTGAAGQILQLDEEGKPEWVDAAEVGATYDSAVSDVSTNAIQNKTIKKYVDDTADTKANVNGHYSTLTSGFAENLVDMKGTGSEQEFIRRTSCGDVSISDDGSGVIQELKGKSIVWNQQLNNGNFASTSGWATAGYYGGTMSVSDNVATITLSGNDGTACDTRHNVSIIAGHKYLVKVDVNGVGTFSGRLSGGTATPLFSDSSVNNSWSIKSVIVTAEDNNTEVAVFFTNATASLQLRNFVIVDLTLMVGAGNEPATVAAFEALYPDDYYAYNPGIIKNNDADGMETVGFNQWDEEWENGAIYASSGQDTSSADTIRCIGYIPVFPSTTYYVRSTATVACYRRFYDINKNYLGVSTIIETNTNAPFTTPAGAYYMRFYMNSAYGASYKGDICINLSWSGYRNGEYEAYWQRTLNLGITTATGKLNGEGESVTIFPKGMAGVGTAYDGGKSDNTGYIREVDKRMDSVDLGDLDWIRRDDIQSGRFASESLPDYAFKSEVTMVCSKYTAVANDIGAITKPDKSIYLFYDPSNPSVRVVYITDTDFANTSAADFKAAMAGVKLWYELATPEHYVLDTPIPTTYKVADFGTETAVAPSGATTPSAPFVAVIKYNDDFTRILATRNKLMLSKESATNLLTALQSAGIIASYTMTYDATDDEYDFTITAPSE